MTKDNVAMTLVYRVLPDGSGVVFASADRAMFIAQIHAAIANAKTWAEFAAAMPPQELEDILQRFDDLEEPRPAADDAFEPMQIHGWTDGDYPPWLQQEMDGLLPHDLLQRFGERCSTAINGAYWFIPEANLPQLCAALEDLGWRVSEAADLPFH